MPRKYTPEERIAAFWAKTTRVPDRQWGDSPCQLWTAGTDAGGYGTFGGEKAHRIAWILANGPIPDGLFVCHRCDEIDPPGDKTSRRCVNSAHLFLGTHQENITDAVIKGRYATGERSGRRRFKDHWPSTAGIANGRAKLTDDQVREICQRRKDGQTLRDIAMALSIGSGTVSNIVKGRTWTHLTGGEIAPDVRARTGRRARLKRAA